MPAAAFQLKASSHMATRYTHAIAKQTEVHAGLCGLATLQTVHVMAEANLYT